MITVSVSFDYGMDQWLVYCQEFMYENYFDRKQPAESDAREKAKKNRPSELVIYNKDDDVSYTQVYN